MGSVWDAAEPGGKVRLQVSHVRGGKDGERSE